MIAACAALLWTCGADEHSARPAAPAAHLPGLPAERLPEAESCAPCHASVVRKWLQHGMADALGPLDAERLAIAPSSDWVPHAASGARHRVEAHDGAWTVVQEWDRLPADLPPPRRALPLVARIGAGVQDFAFAAREGDRWFFAPLELLRAVGWAHAPFQLAGAGAGLGFRLTPECLACHTDAALPEPFPYHALGEIPLRGISCAACHGAAGEHLRDGSAPILNPADLPPPRQLDLCARCHLEGDARIEVAPPDAPAWRPGEDLLARRAVLVARAPGDGAHFVSQVHRLSLSACFRATPAMTCTTCHDPHLPARLQSRADLVAACTDCHRGLQHPPRDETPGADCISCHMPRIEPFDLPHVTTSDHWIRRAPVAPPATGFRDLEAPDGNWEAFRYRATDPPHWTAREVEAFAAMTLADAARHAEAQVRFERWEQPEREPKPARPFEPARLPMLWFMRGLTLAALGRPAEARAAYAAALTLREDFPEARLNLGWSALEAGDPAEAMRQAQALIARHPRADAPHLLAASAHAAEGRGAQAARAVQDSLVAFGAQPLLWQRVGQAALAAGDRAGALRAFLAAWSLDPRLPGLAEDLRRLR